MNWQLVSHMSSLFQIKESRMLSFLRPMIAQMRLIWNELNRFRNRANDRSEVPLRYLVIW